MKIKSTGVIFIIVAALLVQGCNGFFSSAGASRSQVTEIGNAEMPSLIQVVPVTPAVARQVAATVDSTTVRSNTIATHR